MANLVINMTKLYLELSHESLGLGLEAKGLGSDVVMIRLSDEGPLATGSCRFTGDVRRKVGFGPTSGFGSIEARCLGGTSLEFGGSEKETSFSSSGSCCEGESASFLCRFS